MTDYNSKEFVGRYGRNIKVSYNDSRPAVKDVFIDAGSAWAVLEPEQVRELVAHLNELIGDEPVEEKSDPIWESLQMDTLRDHTDALNAHAEALNQFVERFSVK